MTAVSGTAAVFVLSALSNMHDGCDTYKPFVPGFSREYPSSRVPLARHGFTEPAANVIRRSAPALSKGDS